MSARLSSLIGNWSDATQCGFWIVVSGFLMSGQLVVVRSLGDEISVFEILLFRSLFGLTAISGLIVKRADVVLLPNRPGLAILCGVLAFLAGTFFYLAAKELPVADITAIHFIRPVFAAMVAAIVLREALRGSRILAIFAGVVGAAIIVRPGLVEVNIGVLFVLGAVAVQSWNPINRKLLSKSDHPDTVAVWNVLTVLPLAAVTSYFFWTPPTWEQVGWMALIGVLEVANQRVLGRAYLRGDAIVVVALHYTRLPIAAILGLLILSEFPDVWIWVGGGIIAVASIYLTVQEKSRGYQIRNRPD
jgi:drug/metabolite transporter (DMT)-like permease